MQGFKLLRNTVGVPQSIIHKGKQFVIKPGETETFDDILAAVFLERCAPMVEEVVETGEAKYQSDANLVWVANITGNPAASATVKSTAVNRETRKLMEVDVPNPNKAPRTIEREMKGGHKAFYAQDGGLVQLSMGGTYYSIPPRKRIQMPKQIAEWFVSRDNLSGPGRGAVMLCRAPSQFEPDIGWELDDMRAYLRLTDPTADLGPDEATIAQNAKKTVEALEEGAKTSGKTYTESDKKTDLKHQIQEGIRQAKNSCLITLFYKLVDPAYRLPTRAEFNEFVYGKADEELSDEQLAEILAQSEAAEKKKGSRKVRAGL